MPKWLGLPGRRAPATTQCLATRGSDPIAPERCSAWLAGSGPDAGSVRQTAARQELILGAPEHPSTLATRHQLPRSRRPGWRDTRPVPVSDIEGARAALRDGKPAELLGLAECGRLDAKDGVYQLDDPAKAAELVKDVAGFANVKAAGAGGPGPAPEADSGTGDPAAPRRERRVDRLRPGHRDAGDRCASAAARVLAVRGARPGPGGECQPRVGGDPDTRRRRDAVAAASGDPAPFGRRMGGHGRPER